MRNLKKLGCFLAGIVALTAAFGMTSASAAVLCKEAPNKAGECRTVNEGGLGPYPENSEFEATSTNSKLTIFGGVIANVACTDSVIKFKNTAEVGAVSVPIEVSDLSFTGCTSNTGVACTVSTTTGYAGGVTPTDDLGNGTLAFTGNAETQITCGAIFMCKYKVPAAGVTAAFTGGNGATVTFANQKLELLPGGFGCGTEAKWDGTYITIGANKAVWVATKKA